MAHDINLDDIDITRDIDTKQLEEVQKAMEEYERDDNLKAM
jgi:hypothetical protein